jgi:hypothetical protein
MVCGVVPTAEAGDACAIPKLVIAITSKRVKKALKISFRMIIDHFFCLQELSPVISD